ncbi:hypothetical protein GCM10009118_27420 [Wandonia haliotis]|uniref:Uncharacterized protein n=1 Tax=Wandonia haliotis TaxID=574963 RepID=A0ABN1MTI7_9FLAO
MNKLGLFFFTLSILFFSYSYSQDCDSIVKICENQLRNDTNGSLFVSDGQVYQAFINDEIAEFKTTFFGGTTYRIVASAGSADNYVIFTVYDPENRVLFTNKDHKNAPYWDFKVNSTIPVKIETQLDMDKKVSGCAIMLIGFKK